MRPKPFVTIIVPALNEERYIRDAIGSLLRQTEGVELELIVLDGGSADRTPAIVEEMSAADPRVRLEPNPARHQSAAVNRGARIANDRSRIIIRADSHAQYPPGFVIGLVRELTVRKVTSVVVPMRTCGVGFLQRGIAAAQNSRLGNGGASHRTLIGSRFVDHGHHAAFDRRAFLASGGYDESFTHNEDAELDLRLRKTGARIWLCAELAITYFPRSSLRGLARQYFNHGAGRARTLFKHRQFPRLRQLMPLGALGMNATSLACGVMYGWPGLLPGLAYVGACLAGGGMLAFRSRDPAGCAAGPAAIVMHQSWAIGFLNEALRRKVPKSVHHPGSDAPAKATVD